MPNYYTYITVAEAAMLTTWNPNPLLLVRDIAHLNSKTSFLSRRGHAVNEEQSDDVGPATLFPLSYSLKPVKH